MYRSRFWTMRQYAGFGSAEDTNKRFRYLLQQGQTGLSTAFDLPTQMGYDSDHELSRGEVGRVGVAIDTLEDMAEPFLLRLGYVARTPSGRRATQRAFEHLGYPIPKSAPGQLRLMSE